MSPHQDSYRWKISRIVFGPLIFFVIVLLLSGSAGALWLQKGLQEKLVLPFLECEVELVLAGFNTEFHSAGLYAQHLTEQLVNSTVPLTGDLKQLTVLLEQSVKGENNLEGGVKYAYVQFGSAHGELAAIATKNTGNIEYFIKDANHADAAYRFDMRPDLPGAKILSTIAGYDARIRPWYTSAMEQCPVVSPAYASMGNDFSWNVSIVCEVDRDKRLMGVLGIDVAITHLNKILNQVIGSSLMSGIFILDEHNNVILKAEEMTPAVRAFFGSMDGKIRNFRFNKEVLQNLQIEDRSLLTVRADGKEFLLYAHPLGDAAHQTEYLSHFKIVVVASREEVFAVVNNLVLVAYIAGIIIAIGTILLVRLYSGSITNPLKQLRLQAEQVNFGDPSAHNNFARLFSGKLVIDEIDSLQGSVKGMADNLVALYRSLRDAVDTDKESNQLSALGAENFLERVIDSDLTVIVLEVNNYPHLLDALKRSGIARVWRALGQNLRQCCDGLSDSATCIYRYSDNRLVFVLAGDVATHQVIIARLRAGSPIDLKTGTEESVRVAYSLGVVHDHFSGRQAMSDGVNHAVLALRAGQLDGSDFALFEAPMLEQEKRRQALLQAMDAALGNDEFMMYYQPICNLQTGLIHGVEALLRWRSPQFGMVSPAEFIPLAERSERIVVIGNWVLRRVAQDMATLWCQEKLHEDFTAHVNVSVRQLMQTHFSQHVRESVQEFAIPTSLLTLELTESLLIDDGDFIAKQFQELKQLGFGLCLDDFGTGYSSLSTLHKFAFDCLKLDRSFVIRSTEVGPASAVLPGIVAIAKSLQMECVAEGIELPEQADQLRQMGCEYVQGYLFARPMPLHELEIWLEQNQKQAAPA